MFTTIDYIQALHSLIDSYEILSKFHGGNYDFSDEEEEDVSNWRSVIWDNINRFNEKLSRTRR